MINNDKGIVWILSNNPPIAKMILVSAGTEPSAPDPLVDAEGVDLAFITTTIMALTINIQRMIIVFVIETDGDDYVSK